MADPASTVEDTENTTIDVSVTSESKVVNMTTCSKCGAEYNAATPDPHNCGRDAADDDTQYASVAVTVNSRSDGVNMATCSKCGRQYNACLPPGYHQCLSVVDLGGPEPMK